MPEPVSMTDGSMGGEEIDISTTNNPSGSDVSWEPFSESSNPGTTGESFNWAPVIDVVADSFLDYFFPKPKTTNTNSTSNQNNSQSSGMSWIWIVLILVLIGILIWVIATRNKK